MELIPMKGNTYIIEYFDNFIGLYLFRDQSCLLIDSGASPKQGEKIMDLLEQRHWTIYGIFNTHAHPDHTGGNHYIQEKTHCRIYASAWEAAFIQQPLLIPYALYGAYPLKLLQSKFLMPQASQVTDIIGACHVPINGDDFEILDLGGHTLGHMGIRTPDNVIFAGDSLMSIENMKAVPFLYLANPEQQLTTFETIKAAGCSHLCFAHGPWQTDTAAMVGANSAMFTHITDVLKDILRQPRSLEEVMEAIIIRQALVINRNHYLRLTASIKAYLAYLCNQRHVKVYTNNNRLLYHCNEGGPQPMVI